MIEFLNPKHRALSKHALSKRLDENLTLVERLVTHVVLPRDISKKILNDAEKQDHMLIDRMTKTIEESTFCIPDRIVTTFRRFKQVHSDCSAQNVSEQINGLEPGDTFAMLIRNVKCVFMIHRPCVDAKYENIDSSDSESSHTSDSAESRSQCADKSEMVTIASFPSAIDPKDIYSHSSDLQVIFIYYFFHSVETNAIIFCSQFTQLRHCVFRFRK